LKSRNSGVSPTNAGSDETLEVSRSFHHLFKQM
jgi:hypothetical protein